MVEYCSSIFGRKRWCWKVEHKGTKAYNNVIKVIQSEGNIVANTREEALKFLTEAFPGIVDESGKAASKFGYRIDNVSDNASNGLM